MQYRSIVSFFWSHIKPYKWLYCTMLLAPLVGAFHPLAYNYSIKLFLDAMTFKGKFGYTDVLAPIIIFLFIQIASDLVWRISNIAEWKSEPYVRESILLRSYNYVQHHSYTFFQDNFTGAISSKIKGLLDGYDKFWDEMHHGLLLKILTCIVNLSALFFVNFTLGLFFLLWSMVYGPLMYWLSIKLNALSFEETESKHTLIGQVSDRIMNIQSLFSFSSRNRELKSLKDLTSHDFVPKQIHVYTYNFILQVVADSLHIIMLLFVLFYMIHLRIEGAITIGDFAFVFGLILVISRDIWETTLSLQEFSRIMGDYKSCLSILNIPHENQDRNDAIPLKIRSPKIEFKNVNFVYKRGSEVFKDLSLTILPGENIGIVGQSGGGKSSLINLLLRYFELQSGEIWIDGQNIKTVTQDSLREHIAMIPQDTLLFHRTLFENIQYGNPDASKEDVIKACEKAHIHDFIMGLNHGYDSYVGERGLKLSGGQRQRIAIARAILKQAPILILDEATSSLDSHTEEFIQKGLDFFLQDKKKTVIAIAHRLSTLKHMDRILVLDKGKIIEEGTHDQLICNEQSFYAKLWKTQKI